MKFHAGTKPTPLYNGHVFEELEQAILKAQSSINIVLYIWRPGVPSERIIKAIAARTQAGVACRVMVDPVGSTPEFQKQVRPRLLEAKCDVREFRPLHATGEVSASLSRNHRKIAVIDGAVAFTGGFGIFDDWLGNGLSEHQWRDTAVKIEGPVVEDLQVSIAENWQESSGPLLPQADFPVLGPQGNARSAFVASSVTVGPSNADRLLQLSMMSARKRLWISNAYFVPPDNMLEELEHQVKAGVDVRIMVPGPIYDVPSIRAAQRSSYKRLIQSGVRVWEYQPSMMHAKTMVVDDTMSVIGSMNLDPLSMNRLEEGSLVVLDASTNGDLAAHFLQDLEHAKEIRVDSPEIPGLWGKVSLWLFRVFGRAPGR